MAIWRKQEKNAFETYALNCFTQCHVPWICLADSEMIYDVEFLHIQIVIIIVLKISEIMLLPVVFTGL